MGYSVGYDENWKRFVGYGVPAYCDHPGCNEEIDRGFAYICGGDFYGGDRGCGLFFCGEHLIMHRRLPQLCERCSARKKPFSPKPEHPDWINHILTDDSWEKWRKENKEYVEKLHLEIKFKKKIDK